MKTFQLSFDHKSKPEVSSCCSFQHLDRTEDGTNEYVLFQKCCRKCSIFTNNSSDFYELFVEDIQVLDGSGVGYFSVTDA